jgi:hypothetical protein
MAGMLDRMSRISAQFPVNGSDRGLMPNTSPLRTGGAGLDVEREVGAIYLAALWTGDLV